MSILDQIINDKKIEVSKRKNIFPASYLEASPLFERTTKSLSDNLRKSKSGIIAEYKRRSPSKKNINNSLSVIEVSEGYEKAGVSGMSILTDGKYFGGSLDDINLARSATKLPLLRKEFIIDEYQIIEAKAHGADVILLIASVLNYKEIKDFTYLAKKLDLEILLEVHNLQELEKSIMTSIDIIGVNNRNLKNFEVSLDNSRKLASEIPDEFVKISESGINEVESIKELMNLGYRGFLIGENFMKTDNPGMSASDFIKKIER